MKKVTKISALSKFFQAPPNNFKPSMREFKEFKEACSKEEWDEYAKDAAEFLGMTLVEDA